MKYVFFFIVLFAIVAPTFTSKSCSVKKEVRKTVVRNNTPRQTHTSQHTSHTRTHSTLVKRLKSTVVKRPASTHKHQNAVRRPAKTKSIAKKPAPKKTVKVKKPAHKKVTTPKKSVKKPSAKKPAAKKTAPKKPAAKKPAAKKPAAIKPAAKKPVVKKQAAKKPAAKKPVAKKPAAKKPAAKKPAAIKPAAKKPAANKPAVKKPAAKKSSTSNKPNTAKKPSTGTGNKSSTANKPTTTKKPATANKPSAGAGNKSSTANKPNTAKKPVTANKPSTGAGNKSSTANKPTTTKKPATANKPSTGAGNKSSTVNKLTTAKKPVTANKPSTGAGNKSSTANKPTTTKKPATANKSAGGAANKPETANKPTTTKKPSTAIKPTEAKKPITTNKPTAQNNPSVTTTISPAITDQLSAGNNDPSKKGDTAQKPTSSSSLPVSIKPSNITTTVAPSTTKTPLKAQIEAHKVIGKTLSHQSQIDISKFRQSLAGFDADPNIKQVLRIIGKKSGVKFNWKEIPSDVLATVVDITSVRDELASMDGDVSVTRIFAVIWKNIPDFVDTWNGCEGKSTSEDPWKAIRGSNNGTIKISKIKKLLSSSKNLTFEQFVKIIGNESGIEFDKDSSSLPLNITLNYELIQNVLDSLNENSSISDILKSNWTSVYDEDDMSSSDDEYDSNSDYYDEYDSYSDYDETDSNPDAISATTASSSVSNNTSLSTDDKTGSTISATTACSSMSNDTSWSTDDEEYNLDSEYDDEYDSSSEYDNEYYSDSNNEETDSDSDAIPTTTASESVTKDAVVVIPQGAIDISTFQKSLFDLPNATFEQALELLSGTEGVKFNYTSISPTVLKKQINKKTVKKVFRSFKGVISIREIFEAIESTIFDEYDDDASIDSDENVVSDSIATTAVPSSALNDSLNVIANSIPQGTVNVSKFKKSLSTLDSRTLRQILELLYNESGNQTDLKSIQLSILNKTVSIKRMKKALRSLKGEASILEVFNRIRSFILSEWDRDSVSGANSSPKDPLATIGESLPQGTIDVPKFRKSLSELKKMTFGQVLHLLDDQAGIELNLKNVETSILNTPVDLLSLDNALSVFKEEASIPQVFGAIGSTFSNEWTVEASLDSSETISGSLPSEDAWDFIGDSEGSVEISALIGALSGSKNSTFKQFLQLLGHEAGVEFNLSDLDATISNSPLNIELIKNALGSLNGTVSIYDVFYTVWPLISDDLDSESYVYSSVSSYIISFPQNTTVQVSDLKKSLSNLKSANFSQILEQTLLAADILFDSKMLSSTILDTPVDVNSIQKAVNPLEGEVTIFAIFSKILPTISADWNANLSTSDSEGDSIVFTLPERFSHDYPDHQIIGKD